MSKSHSIFMFFQNLNLGYSCFRANRQSFRRFDTRVLAISYSDFIQLQCLCLVRDFGSNYLLLMASIILIPVRHVTSLITSSSLKFNHFRDFAFCVMYLLSEQSYWNGGGIAYEASPLFYQRKMKKVIIQVYASFGSPHAKVQQRRSWSFDVYIYIFRGSNLQNL